MTQIYLDHHSSTFLSEEVLALMLPQMKSGWGSLLQPHSRGQGVISDQEKSFKSFEDVFDVSTEDFIVFTASKSEAINQVLDTVYHQITRKTGQNHYITLSTEEAAQILTLEKYKDLGCHTTLIDPVATGSISQKITEAITPRTALITLTLADGLTGIYYEIEELVKICKLRGIKLHLDVTYALNSRAFSFKESGADFVTLGGDILKGPKSSGLLMAKKETQLKPFICGEEEQKGLRGAPLDMAALVGLAHACTLLKARQMNLEVPRLRDLFEKKCKAIEGVDVLFKENRLFNVSVLAFQGVHSDALLYALNKRGVLASMGGGKFQKLSLVLQKLGVPSKKSETALSFSLSDETTKEEVLKAVEIIQEEFVRLSRLSEKLEGAYV